jgi:hypothetical protein
VLASEFPECLKLPDGENGVQNAFETFEKSLHGLLSFKDLPQVYQVFRELGNLFVVIKNLEVAMVSFDNLCGSNLSFIFNIIFTFSSR